jgi:hypothetical protein
MSSDPGGPGGWELSGGGGLWTPSRIAGALFVGDPVLSAMTLSGSTITAMSDAAGSGRSVSSGAGIALDTSTTLNGRPTFKLTSTSALYTRSGGCPGAAPFTLAHLYRLSATTGYNALKMGGASNFGSAGAYASLSVAWTGHQDSAAPDGQNYASGIAADMTEWHFVVHSYDATYSRAWIDGALYQGAWSRQVTGYGENPYPDANYDNDNGFGWEAHSPGFTMVGNQAVALWVAGAISAADNLLLHAWILRTFGAIASSTSRKASFAGGVNSRDNGYNANGHGASDVGVGVDILSQTAALLSTPMVVTPGGVTGQTVATLLAKNHGLAVEQEWSGYLSLLGSPRIADVGSMADNDLGCAGGAATSLSVAQANAVSLVSEIHALCPGAIVVARTMLPSANSARASTYDPNMATWNEWLLGGGSGADRVVDTGRISALVTSVGNSGSSLWSGDAGGNIHLSATGIALQAAVYQAGLNGLGIT